MTTIGMHYDVLPGKEHEFEKGFLSVLEHLKGVAGHEESHLYQDVQSAGSYMILSRWRDRESFDAFLRSPEFKAATTWGKEQILRGRPRHKVFKDG